MTREIKTNVGSNGISSSTRANSGNGFSVIVVVVVVLTHNRYNVIGQSGPPGRKAGGDLLPDIVVRQQDPPSIAFPIPIPLSLAL